MKQAIDQQRMNESCSPEPAVALFIMLACAIIRQRFSQLNGRILYRLSTLILQRNMMDPVQQDRDVTYLQLQFLKQTWVEGAHVRLTYLCETHGIATKTQTTVTVHAEVVARRALSNALKNAWSEQP